MIKNLLLWPHVKLDFLKLDNTAFSEINGHFCAVWKKQTYWEIEESVID